MVVVIFRSRLDKSSVDEYAEVVERIEELARRAPGFISIEFFSAEDGERLSLVQFESDADAAAWKRDPEHLEAQKLGRERFYTEYKLQVCRPIREYGFEREKA